MITFDSSSVRQKLAVASGCFRLVSPPKLENAMNERRTRRSDVPEKAVTLLLENALKSKAVKAISLTSEEGLLIAGAGAVDAELLGATGSVCMTSSMPFQGDTLYVETIPVDGMGLRLSTLGAPLSDRSMGQSVQRILKSRRAA
jgi:hypothetical protein